MVSFKHFRDDYGCCEGIEGRYGDQGDQLGTYVHVRNDGWSSKVSAEEMKGGR